MVDLPRASAYLRTGLFPTSTAKVATVSIGSRFSGVQPPGGRRLCCVGRLPLAHLRLRHFLPRLGLRLAMLVLAIALADGRALSPWAMGIPYGVGQLLVAGILFFTAQEGSDED